MTLVVDEEIRMGTMQVSASAHTWELRKSDVTAYDLTLAALVDLGWLTR